MARPKGSKNKIKQNGVNAFTLQTNFEKQIEGAPINRNSNRGWINWGQRNDYPLRLSELYYNSIIHKSCIDFAVDSIIGDGVDYEKMNINGSETVPNYTQTWDDFVKCLALDYVLYGSYAFQIIKNKDGKTYSFYHQPMASVRCSPRDEDGVITSYFISDDWTKIGQNPPIELPRFGFTEDEVIKSGQSYLFVYESYTPDLTYYTSPKYVGAIKAIKTELELIRYDLRSVTNNFSANGFLILPRVESDEERLDVMREVKNSFVGSDNANSLVVLFSNGDENEANQAKYVKIEKDSDNVDLFSQSNERNIDRIIAAHRIPSKALIGVPMDSSGFSNQGEMLQAAYNLYNLTVGKTNRNSIVTTINKMFKLNGLDTQIFLKPLSFTLGDEAETNEEHVENTPNVNDANENNIQEQETNIE